MSVQEMSDLTLFYIFFRSFKFVSKNCQGLILHNLCQRFSSSNCANYSDCMYMRFLYRMFLQIFF